MSAEISEPSNGIVAVTGGNRGLGAAIVAALAARGFTVGCLSRDGAGPEQDGLGDELQ